LVDKPHKKPHVLLPAAIGRLFPLLMAILLWTTDARPKWLILTSTVVVVAGFWIGDGLASVPWFDLLSNAIPPRRRGRLTGTGQVLSGIMGFVAGFFVEGLLSDRGPPFPNNYALLFFLGFSMLAISYSAITMIVEEKGASVNERPSWREYVPQLWKLVKRDRVFQRFISARMFSGFATLSIPFYMPYALQELGLPTQVAGRYTSIGVVGSILAATLFGWLNERYGSKRVIVISLALSVLVPIIALLIPMAIADPGYLSWGYGLVFLCLNAMMSSMMPGWTTYILEWAPQAERPMYVGLTNTLNGITPLFALLGGLILQWSGDDYRLLFAITAAGLAVVWPLPLSLPEARDRDSDARQGPTVG
jgi:MFS family permease